jgi:hypothetical protein
MWDAEGAIGSNDGERKGGPTSRTEGAHQYDLSTAQSDEGV